SSRSCDISFYNDIIICPDKFIRRAAKHRQGAEDRLTRKRGDMRRPKKKTSAATERPAARADAVKEPLYLKLVQAIKQDIKSGRAPIGALLPSEIELGRQHDVSRHTVREALRQLRVEGLVAA